MREVAACVRAGGTVIFPTETVYGIGCDPDNAAAIDAIFAAKGRSADKPLALHVADAEQAAPFVAGYGASARAAVQALWPGPVAIIVRRDPRRYERASCGLATISLRCPDHELCRSLLRACGPLAATSANRSGASAYTGGDVALNDLPQASMAVLAGPTAYAMESTILDCTDDAVRVVREGAVPFSLIRQKLENFMPGGIR